MLVPIFKRLVDTNAWLPFSAHTKRGSEREREKETVCGKAMTSTTTTTISKCFQRFIFHIDYEIA